MIPPWFSGMHILKEVLYDDTISNYPFFSIVIISRERLKRFKCQEH